MWEERLTFETKYKIIKGETSYNKSKYIFLWIVQLENQWNGWTKKT